MKFNFTTFSISLCVTTACVGVLCLCFVPLFLINGIVSYVATTFTLPSSMKSDLPGYIAYVGYGIESYLFKQTSFQVTVDNKPVETFYYKISDSKVNVKDSTFTFSSEPGKFSYPFQLRGLNFFASTGDHYTVKCDDCDDGSWIVTSQWVKSFIDNANVTRNDDQPHHPHKQEDDQDKHHKGHRHEHKNGRRHRHGRRHGRKHGRRHEHSHALTEAQKRGEAFVQNFLASEDRKVTPANIVAVGDSTDFAFTAPYNGGFNLFFLPNDNSTAVSRHMTLTASRKEYELTDLRNVVKCPASGCDVPIKDSSSGIVFIATQGINVQADHGRPAMLGLIALSPSMIIVAALALCFCSCMSCGALLSLSSESKNIVPRSSYNNYNYPPQNSQIPQNPQQAAYQNGAHPMYPQHPQQPPQYGMTQSETSSLIQHDAAYSRYAVNSQ